MLKLYKSLISCRLLYALPNEERAAACAQHTLHRRHVGAARLTPGGWGHLVRVTPPGVLGRPAPLSDAPRRGALGPRN